MKSRTIIFVHIRKTAGISLRSLIKGRFSPEYYFKEKTPQHLRELPVTERKKLKFISGHAPYGLHKLLPQKCEYITLLREPTDRIISLYKHLLRKGQDITFRELIESEKNNQVLMFGTNFNEAKKRLDEFAFVGITERFDESVVVFRKKFGLKRMHYTKKENVGKEKAKIDSADLEYFKKINTDGYKIYQID